jgi:hypothetical protein
MPKSGRPSPLPPESVDVDRVLAFVNTLSSRPTDTPVERLSSYDALVEWAREQHLISAAAAERLTAEARRHPHQAAGVVLRARQFREALNGLAESIARERQPSAAVLNTLSDYLAAAYANGRLVAHDGGLQWVASTDDALERILWEIGRATGRLVLPHQHSRLRSVRLRMVVHGRHQEPLAALVRYEDLRKSREDPAVSV